MLLPAFAYVWLQTVIRRTGSQSRDAYAYHRQTTRKGVFATFLYVSGLALTFVSPWLGIACAALVVLFWFLPTRSEEHTSELQSLMRISYAVFCLKKKTLNYRNRDTTH